MNEVNRVQVNQGAKTVYQASLQEFKSMFAMKGTAFKYSSSATKGSLYVKDGQLCSANTRGGSGTVTSSVTNLALRNALIDAFRNAGATETFLLRLRNELIDGVDTSGDLSRRTVRDLIDDFENEAGNRQSEQDVLESRQALSRQAFGSMLGTESLVMDDFRKLALGSGYVGEVLEGAVMGNEDPDRDSTWVVLEHDTKNEDYNASLRRRLYEIVRDAPQPENLPADQRCARELLLQHLKSMLIGSDLKKPLSCDEIRRTLTALDRNMGYVPPKALSDRAIKVTRANENFAQFFDQFEKDAERIDSFLSSHALTDEKPSGLLPEYADALRCLSTLKREMVDIARQYLRQDKFDEGALKDHVMKIYRTFILDNHLVFSRLADLDRLCGGIVKTKKGGKVGFEYPDRNYPDLTDLCRFDDQDQRDAFLKDCHEILPKAIRIGSEDKKWTPFSEHRVVRCETVPITTTSGEYIDEIVNNAAGGDCLFYAVEDAKSDKLPGVRSMNDSHKAQDLREKLAKYIRDTVPIVAVDEKGALRIPHSCGYEKTYLFDDAPYAEKGTYIPVEHIPFLASMLKRPIVLLKDLAFKGRQTSEMFCYNRDVSTGDKLQGEPIVIHYDNRRTHYQAAKLNEAGLAKYRELTRFETIDEAAGQNVDNRLGSVGAPAPKAAGNVHKSPKLRAEEFMARNGVLIEGLIYKLGLAAGENFSPESETLLRYVLSPESETLLRHVLQHSVESLYAEGVEKTDVIKKALTAPGSAFDSMRKMVNDGTFSMGMATHALSLPPKEADAFLKACLLVPDMSYGTICRFRAVASKLVRLSPAQFTPENVMRLARPDLAFPSGLKDKARLVDFADRELLFAPLRKRVDDSDLYKATHPRPTDTKRDDVYFVHFVMQTFVSSGMFAEDIHDILKQPKETNRGKEPNKFTLKMLPESFFLPQFGASDKGVSDAVESVFKDLPRLKPQITILTSTKGPQRPIPPEAYNDSNKNLNNPELLKDFTGQIAALCGPENTVQQQLVHLFLTQNAAVPEQLMNACFGRNSEPLLNTQILLKADSKTGDVYVSKTTDPDLDFGMSVTIRIGRDGAMSVVDLQERKTPGELVPLDGKGRPMAPQPKVNQIPLVEKYEEVVANKCNELTELLEGSQSQKVTEESKGLLGEVLRRAVQGHFIEKGTADGLWGEGSVFDSIKSMAKHDCLLPTTLMAALSLPPEEIRVFFRSCAMVKAGPRAGLLGEIWSVTGELCRLPPDQLTPKAVLELAKPDWPLPETLRDFTDPKNDKIKNDDVDHGLNIIGGRMNQMVFERSEANRMSGMAMALTFRIPSYEDIQSVLSDPKKLTFEMFSPHAFLPEVGSLFDHVEAARKLFRKDVVRDRPQITIAREKVQPYESTEDLYKSVDAQQEFFDEIGNVCKSNLQQRNVIFFMTQNAQEPAKIVHLARQWNANPDKPYDYSPTPVHYDVRRDEGTGDLFVTMRSNWREDQGVEVTVRFGADGSRTLVSAREQPYRPAEKTVLPAVEEAKRGLEAILAKYGFPPDAKRDGRMVVRGNTLTATLSRLYKEVHDGTLAPAAAAEKVREAYATFVDGVLPQDDYAKATRNPSNERYDKAVGIELRKLKDDLPTGIFHARVDESDSAVEEAPKNGPLNIENADNAREAVLKNEKPEEPDPVVPTAKSEAHEMAERCVLEMPDNEAFVETGVRYVNGVPQSYKKLSVTGEQLAQAAFKACRKEYSELKTYQSKMRYQLEFEKHVRAKIEASADQFIQNEYFQDALSNAPGDARRAVSRMLAARSDLGTVCYEGGKLTSFGLCVVNRAVTLCRNECSDLKDAASRREYMKGIKAHLNEALQTLLGQYATVFNSILKPPLENPQSHVSQIFKMEGFAKFATSVADDRYFNPAFRAAKKETELWQRGEELTADYRESVGFVDLVNTLREDVRSLFLDACNANLTKLFIAALKQDKTDPNAGGQMRAEVLARGCIQAVLLADKLETESGIVLQPADRVGIAEAFIRDVVVKLAEEGPGLEECRGMAAEQIRSKLTNMIEAEAKGIAEKRLAALQGVTGLDAFSNVAQSDFQRGVLDGSINDKIAPYAVMVAVAFKQGNQVDFPENPTPKQKLAALTRKLTEAVGAVDVKKTGIKLDAQGAVDSLKVTLRILSTDNPDLVGIVQECGPETVSAYSDDLTQECLNSGDEYGDAKLLMEQAEANELPETVTKTKDEILAEYEEVGKRYEFLMHHSRSAGAFAGLWGRSIHDTALPAEDIDAIELAKMAETMPQDDGRGSEPERKAMERFRNSVAESPDPQDRAFLLATADERIAESLALMAEDAGQAVRELASMREHILRTSDQKLHVILERPSAPGAKEQWEIFDHLDSDKPDSDKIALAERNREMRGWLADQLAEVGRRNPKLSFVMKDWGAKLTSKERRSSNLLPGFCRMLLVIIDKDFDLPAPSREEEAAYEDAFSKLSDYFTRQKLPGSMSADEAREMLNRFKASVSPNRKKDPDEQPAPPAERRAQLRDMIASLELRDENARNLLLRNLEAGYDPDLQNVPLTDDEVRRTIYAVEKGKTFVSAPLPGNLEHERELHALKHISDIIKNRRQACEAIRTNVLNDSCKAALADWGGALDRIAKKFDAHLEKDSESVNAWLLLMWAQYELKAVEDRHPDAIWRLRDLAEALEREAEDAHDTGIQTGGVAEIAHEVLAPGKKIEAERDELRQYLPSAVSKIFNSPIVGQRPRVGESGRDAPSRQGAPKNDVSENRQVNGPVPVSNVGKGILSQVGNNNVIIEEDEEEIEDLNGVLTKIDVANNAAPEESPEAIHRRLITGIVQGITSKKADELVDLTVERIMAKKSNEDESAIVKSLRKLYMNVPDRSASDYKEKLRELLTDLLKNSMLSPRDLERSLENYGKSCHKSEDDEIEEELTVYLFQKIVDNLVEAKCKKLVDSVSSMSSEQLANSFVALKTSLQIPEVIQDLKIGGVSVVDAIQKENTAVLQRLFENLMKSAEGKNSQLWTDYIPGVARSLYEAEDINWRDVETKNAFITGKLVTALLLKALELSHAKRIAAYVPTNANEAVWEQSPDANTCPIMSVVNAMLSNAKNAPIVKNVVDSKTGEFEFPVAIEGGNEGDKLYEPVKYTPDLNKKYETRFRKDVVFTPFEKAALLAMLEKVPDAKDHIVPGTFFEAMNVGRIFGKGDAVITGWREGQTPSDFEIWQLFRRAADALEAGKPCVLRLPNHFIAVTGIKYDANKHGALPALVVWDSSHGSKETIPFDDLRVPDRQLYVFGDELYPLPEPDPFGLNASELRDEAQRANAK